jgi:hypothetical protein
MYSPQHTQCPSVSETVPLADEFAFNYCDFHGHPLWHHQTRRGLKQRCIVWHFQLTLLQVLLYLIQQKSQCMQLVHNLIGLGFFRSLTLIET